MIYPVTIPDEDLLALHKKLNKLRGNLTLEDVRNKASKLIDDYIQHDLLEELYEEYE